MYKEQFNTKLNAFELFSILKDDSHCFFLDSGMDCNKLGRYSFIGSEPFLIFKSKNEDIEILQGSYHKSIKGNPFEELQLLFDKYTAAVSDDLPFTGGAVGYFGYDLCHFIEKLPRKAVDDVCIPDSFFGFYDTIIAVDHKTNECFAASNGFTGCEKDNVKRLIKRIKCNENKIISKPLNDKYREVQYESNFTKENYIKAVENIREYILSGDIYQANLTQRFRCNTTKSPFELYEILRTINPAPFAAFMDIGEAHILCSSPERFLKISSRFMETRPIKGTRPRGKTMEEDLAYREELLSSEKDKSELLMIVDLERNDLGRVSEPGSVKVEELFHLEEYATVYHLVATITGKIRDEYTEFDAIKAAFPGGSITGAPKIRAMEIIDELEPAQRNIYTGSIGYMGFNRNIDLNIVIRTILLKDGAAYFQAGGGIVWDSDPEEEYKESLQKAKAMMNALAL
ncbi:MAG: aminodeoxychorismate synthase component I [Bacillota bacterium]